ncbi:hemerythrin domain-containing protein [Sphingomonas sp. RRHST34]|uniref:Hemerythrin domain-containing protein n=1 Tax=Sphingomonas citri TaxID=2862499 RepID=A0ABS7BSP8_9SPHN|nr:hemerythrin domain-containing protein [Sphingomonas citri]MBW6532627.1 hemerythrin domain-containing protein [Sphingomonas citri]
MLDKQHASLKESAAALRFEVDRPTPDMEALARAKWRLGYRLAVHLAHEDRHVYPILIAHADHRIASLAALYEREMGDLDQRFRDYIARWSSDMVTSEWPAYRLATYTILDALAQRIDREDRELYPLVDDERASRR